MKGFERKLHQHNIWLQALIIFLLTLVVFFTAYQ